MQTTEPRSGSTGILVVDDERQIVNLLTRYLVQHGFRASGAFTPEEARRKVEADPGIGVVVSDLRMPGQSGLALAEELRRGRPESAALEVVLITGAGVDEPALGAFGTRPFEVLRKPFRPSEVAAAAARALASSEQRRMRAGGGAGPRGIPGLLGGDLRPPRTPAEERQALLAAIAEGLRVPLLPMLSAAEAMSSGPPMGEAEMREQARRIRDSGLRMLEAIDEALGALGADQPAAPRGGGQGRRAAG